MPSPIWNRLMMMTAAWVAPAPLSHGGPAGGPGQRVRGPVWRVEVQGQGRAFGAAGPNGGKVPGGAEAPAAGEGRWWKNRRPRPPSSRNGTAIAMYCNELSSEMRNT